MRGTGAAAALHQRGHAARLAGTTHFVERVAVIAHDAASFVDVAELVGQLQQFLLASLRVERFQRGCMGTPSFPVVLGDPDA